MLRCLNFFFHARSLSVTIFTGISLSTVSFFARSATSFGLVFLLFCPSRRPFTAFNAAGVHTVQSSLSTRGGEPGAAVATTCLALSSFLQFLQFLQGSEATCQSLLKYISRQSESYQQDAQLHSASLVKLYFFNFKLQLHFSQNQWGTVFFSIKILHCICWNELC